MLKISSVALSCAIAVVAVVAANAQGVSETDLTKFSASGLLAPAPTGQLNVAPPSAFAGVENKFSISLPAANTPSAAGDQPSMAMNSGMTPAPSGGPLPGFAAGLEESRFGSEKAGEPAAAELEKLTAVVPASTTTLGLNVSNSGVGATTATFGSNNDFKLGK